MQITRQGFTLIELLIVVAIIAILAAIAVPNFLEAQVRAKVSRGKTDMRSMSTALESYKIDTNQYPPDAQYYTWGGGDPNDPFAQFCLGRLTTPVAYMTSIPQNVFRYARGWNDGEWYYSYKAINFWGAIMRGDWIGPIPADSPLRNPDTGEIDADMSKMWILYSVGPDQTGSMGEYALFGEKALNRVKSNDPGSGNDGAIYDATNGTISNGDIVRVGP